MPTRQRANFGKRQALDADAQAWLRCLPCGFYEFKPESELAALWGEHGDDIVEEHVAEFPGTRPQRWYEYSAPRSPRGTYPGCYYDGELPEPRKRLGGIGTPDFEVMNIKPSFAFGLPVSWVDQTDCDYYNRRGAFAHVAPNPNNEPFKGVAIDDSDPPRFESESSYLDRLGLLLPGEKRRIKKDAWEPETMEYVE
jgi:hypothetical protein